MSFKVVQTGNYSSKSVESIREWCSERVLVNMETYTTVRKRGKRDSGT